MPGSSLVKIEDGKANQFTEPVHSMGRANVVIDY